MSDDPKFDLKVFNPEKKKRRRQVAAVAPIVEEVQPEKEIPTPSTASLVPNAWLAEDKANGKERDYLCVPLSFFRIPSLC